MKHAIVALVVSSVCYLASGCGSPNDGHVGSSDDAPCFGVDLDLEVHLASAEEASRRAREVGVTIPVLPEDPPFEVSWLSLIETDDADGLSLGLEAPGEYWPSGSLRLTPLNDCFPPSRSNPVANALGVPIYREAWGSLIHYIASFSVNGTFVEARLTWSTGWPVPSEQEQLAIASTWISNIVDQA
jgi:hypothetical protein